MENDDSDVDVPAHSIQIVDPQVVKRWYTPDQSLIQPAKMRHPELPPGTNVAGITTHSSSLWTRTARIDTVVNGHAVRYFLKVGGAGLTLSYLNEFMTQVTYITLQATFGERGRKMVYGEFIAMTRMHRASPMLVPKPLACGTYETIPDVHFFLCEFRDMDNKLPDIERFPAAVAKMHRNAASPDGRYGFDCTTYHGNVPIEHGWSDSWEAYFARTTRVLFDMEQEVRGTNEEIIRLSEPFFDKVVPRLLRPLDQQPIKPTLVHGDLWHGNAAMDKETSRPIIYDAAGFYAHNECKSSYLLVEHS